MQNHENKNDFKNKQGGKKMQDSKKKKSSKKTLWISLSVCVSLALIVLLAVLVLGNKTTAFSFSDDIDDNGLWEGITALDYVENLSYLALSIPKDIHQVSDANLQEAIDTLLANYSPEVKQITDRAVANGDKVNIDYVGSVGGVEFQGGSTGGTGTDVTAGSPNYIDDFLMQIIGHKPGETINVEVTFPDVYSSNPDLQGKDAVFVTTINYISETVLTDAFIEEKLSSVYGWKTIDEMKEAQRTALQKIAIQNYILDYLTDDVTVSSIPDKITKYQENALLYSLRSYAKDNSINVQELLNDEGVSTESEFIEKYSADNLKNSRYSLVVQAVAEDAGISVSNEDMTKYLPDYSSYTEQYGLPYLKQYVLALKVLDRISENAVLV